jgi:type II secretory pathway pseudopilin PulG
MERLLPTLRRRVRERLAGEGGFTLVELVLASGLMALVMSSLAYVGTVAFADASLGRSRQTATALVNQALEQVRAIKYDTLSLGLATTDLQAGGDSAITSSGGVYRYDGERIPNGANAAIAPLVPHRSTKTVDGDPYVLAVYVTYLDDDPTSGALRVTARASWTSGVRGGSDTFVEAQTVVAPCDDPTHPFCAPDQPYLYANSEVSEGGITISAFNGIGISGVDFDQGSLWLPTQSTNMQVEQIEAVASSAKTSGTTLRDASGAEVGAGRQAITVGADSDPSQSKPPYATSTVGGSTGPTVQVPTDRLLEGSTGKITLTSSGGDAATATATVLSTAANTCANAALTPVNQLDSLPCGNATTTQGSTMTAQLNLNALGNVTLASIGGAAVSSAAHTNRDTAAQPSSCASTSGDGCIHASHRQAIGSIVIADLPSTMSALLPSFDGLLKLTGFTRTVIAEAGVGNANPSVVTTGTLQYWNGVGYTSTVLSGAGGVAIPLATVSVSNATAATTLSIGGTVSTGATTAPACPSPCSDATAQAASPMIADIRYTVIVAGSTIVDLLVHIDLGTLLAHAQYTPSV